MASYLLSVHSAYSGERPPMTEEEMRHGHELVDALESEMKSAGALVFGGRLQGPRSARMVRVSERKARTTDGPFAETKEYLGGFYIINAANDEEANAWASKVASTMNIAMEVRPFADVSRQ